jgi:hypothetical protein
MPVARAAAAADHATFARLFPELGVDDPLPTPDQFTARMVPRTLILEDGGDAVGYGFWQVYGRTAREDRVLVFVEGDRALYQAIAAVGAELRHALFRMGAALK